MRLDHITKDDVEGLSFSGTASNTNCALRTLRRMLHKAEEWNLLGKVPKFKLLREHGRRLRLDDDAEQRLLVAASACSWKPDSFELFRDVIILARDTGMRNQRELYCMRKENLDWNNRIRRADDLLKLAGDPRDLRVRLLRSHQVGIFLVRS